VRARTVEVGGKPLRDVVAVEAVQREVLGSAVGEHPRHGVGDIASVCNGSGALLRNVGLAVT
jgi:hypothetical protein